MACPMCGASFERRPGKRFCSRQCQLRSRNEPTQVGRRGPRTCKSCGDIFVVTYPDKRRSFCSNECSRRYQHRIGEGARRARAAGVASIHRYDPIAILERDGYRCQMCGCATPPELRGTSDPRAPEVDHIIPLSQGGAHSVENSQCLCWRCNRRKAIDERRKAA